MKLSDFHTHTKYSFDSTAEPEDMVLSAIEKGLQTIAITDHADVDCEDQGLKWDFSFVGRTECINSLKNKYKDQIKILHGIELGQPYNREAFSEELVRKNEFDLVLGSVHNLTSFPDFCFLRFDHIPENMTEVLLKRYINENESTENGIWDTNIFGKTVEQLVNDGIAVKTASIGEECQLKLQDQNSIYRLC